MRDILCVIPAASNFALNFLDALEIFGRFEKVDVPKNLLLLNAVAEATFKIIKTKFVRNHHFQSLEELNEKLASYVNWFNRKRIYSTLGYLSPVKYKLAHLKITV